VASSTDRTDRAPCDNPRYNGVVDLRINPDSPTPPFEQIRAQITAAAREGRLAPGSRLPTVRDLAATLGLAVNTVARSYRELEADGVIVTRGRSGSFIADSADPVRAEAERAAREYASRAQRLALTPQEAAELLVQSWELVSDAR